MSLDIDKLISKLNTEQREAVEYPPAPMLILAGAGSGKTRVLTHRIAYLIQKHYILPSEIIAVTFTNKAAQEMSNRIHKIMGSHCHDLTVSTFHSASANMLRRHISKLGYTEHYVIYDDSDQITLLRHVIQDMGLSPKTHDPRFFRQLIDRAKNNLQWPSQVTSSSNTGIEVHFPQVYKNYQKRLKEANALDFGDLLLLCVRILEEHFDVRQYYINRYKHLLIDEYQDTNHAQYKLAQLLTNPESQSICVVGDEDQSIYGFRGADISNILNFTRDYPTAKVIKLEQNYRSTAPILTAATAVVSHNLRRIGKKLWTEEKDGEFLQYIETDSDVDEAERVANEIHKLRGYGYKYEDIAVFYRANHQSRPFEEMLNYSSIPYFLVGQGFYDRKEIRDIRAYLQLIYNPSDNISLDRILNEPPRGIGEQSRAYLYHIANEQKCSCVDALKHISEEPKKFAPFGPKLAAFGNLINRLSKESEILPIRELVAKILEETGYQDYLKRQGTIEAESRIDNLTEFISVASEFDMFPGKIGLQHFLERITLKTQSDKTEELDSGRVTLMTFHNAKGLEFPIVFMVGMEEGLFPHFKTTTIPEQLEEERRLCYVGMTRAMKRLYLMRARRRFLFGKVEQSQPSRFLKEIPQEWMKGARGFSVGNIYERYSTYNQNKAIQNNIGINKNYEEIKNKPGNHSKLENTFLQNKALQENKILQEKILEKTSSTSSNQANNTYDNKFKDKKDKLVYAPIEDEDPFLDLKVGRRVTHPVFGEGIIKEREGDNLNPRLVIYFKSSGLKKIMAKHAVLEIIYS